MKIALLDSGINIGYRDFINKEIRIHHKADIQDKNGHGTACAGEIFNVSPNAELVVFRILDRYARGSLKDLISALERCLEDSDIRIICISSSCQINDKKIIEYLQEIVNRIFLNNQIIVASLENRSMKGYPAALNNVIAINYNRSREKEDRFRFHTRKLQCTYYSHNHVMPWKDGLYHFFNGNSSAAPRFAGFIFNILQKKKFSNIELIQYLRVGNDKINSHYYTNKNKKANADTIDFICRHFLIKDDKYRNHKIKSNLENITDQSVTKLLNSLDVHYKCKLDYKQFIDQDFQSISLLCKKIDELIRQYRI